MARGTEIGKAFLQIVPSAQGIEGSINDLIGGDVDNAGKTAGNSLVSNLKKIIVAAGIGKVLMDSINEGAKLQQSLGGVETIYKESADKMVKYANQAYKTANVSANDYLEMSTAFGASLLQSTGGDTEKAAEAANTAIMDMADNANKFGTDMASIQTAYQGFAKQNYTMLDNLKLGYGGTKTEMERLLKDAQKLTGVKYNINNLNDVYDAIHVVQKELGVTGTTAKESASTFSGSMATMKAAFSNFMGNLSLGQDIGPSLTALFESVQIFLFSNLLPMIGNIIKSIPGLVQTFITEGIPMLLQSGYDLLVNVAQGILTGIPAFREYLMQFIADFQLWVTEQLPILIQSGVDWILGLANGMLSNIPGVLESMGEIILSLLGALMDAIPSILDGGSKLIEGLAKGLFDNLPAIVRTMTKILGDLIKMVIDKGPDVLRKGFELIGKLAMGLWDNLPSIIRTIGNLLTELLAKIGSYLPDLLTKGFDLIVELGKGLIKAIPDAVKKIPEIINALLDEARKFISKFSDIGKNLVEGLWRGIGSVKDWIVSKISGFFGGIVDSIKNFFGIHSPSKLFRDEIGSMLGKGLGLGITDEIGTVSKAMDELEAETLRDMSSNVGYKIATDAKSLLNSDDSLLSNKSSKPLILRLILGGREFKTFVEDITDIQEKELKLSLDY